MKKNILIVDDSALMRRVLYDIVNTSEGFTAKETAANGHDALKLLQKKEDIIDAVLLDINMPGMNGIEFLEELRKQGIECKVIIVSAAARNDAKETIRALELGAFDFVTKPESYIEVMDNSFSDRIIECLTEATLTKCHSAGKRSTPLKVKKNGIEEIPKIAPKMIPKMTPKVTGNPESKVVALACSTGGPKALHTVIPKLPANLNAGILIVQHMPEGFTKSLADRLNDISAVHVKEAQDQDILERGTVYIAKGGHHMRVIRQSDNSYRLSVTKEPARHGLLPCADIMYESLLDSDFDQITCVVLTGMGSDGTAGIRQLNQKKNIYVIAQNERTCTVYGMPKALKDAGLVDEEAGLDEISDAILKNVGVYNNGC